MEVEELPERLDGMLFVYDTPRSVSYHMQNTPMPLDIWWFDLNGVLIGSAEMEPCFIESCTNYRSPGPVMWVLETPRHVYEFEHEDQLSTG